MYPTRLLFVALCLIVCGGAGSVLAQDADVENVFRSDIRTTEPLSGPDQLAMLQVPEGFEVTLFASEPAIQKPLNMAFDADGRLWVTGSNLYPLPAKENEPATDQIRILEDTDGDGVADQNTLFADNLNIPMGLYPWKDGVVVFSIPNILFLRDTDGDGKADKREVLYGPFDTTRDTHGLNNAFRRGFDGWLYCCHGFNNQSKVAGTDGHEVSLPSGNTYRIRLDGSRIENFSNGQVNPFGMTIDANGDIFTSDCHTKPVTLLLRHGAYESFGRPHDGLGFVPSVMDHLHGSTAIAAICQYQGNRFPDDYHEDIFVGNVMTGRVHRNSIERNGSSIRMKEEDDFLISKDPWFRPVDIQSGPDGALYIADFYNRIIGHYEVPLDHPGRDRSSGRIWRVSFVNDTATSDVPDLHAADLADLIATLQDDRTPLRQLAADEIVDRIGKTAVPDVVAAINLDDPSSDQTAVPHLLWILHRLNDLTSSQLEAAIQSETERTRIHALRICSEHTSLSFVEPHIRLGLRDRSTLVQRAAADAASQHASVVITKEVINATALCPATDIHLKHALKIALRNQFADGAVVDWFVATTPPVVASQAVANILPGVKNDAAGRLAVVLLSNGRFSGEEVSEIVRHAARFATDTDLNQLISLAAEQSGDSLDLRTKIWSALADALRGRNSSSPDTFVRWSNTLATEIFESVNLQKTAWGAYHVPGTKATKWGMEPRSAAGAPTIKASFLSSKLSGERSTGLLRSRTFTIPLFLELQLCGHLGPPDAPPIPQNRVVLRDFTTGAELRSVLAPRNDVAQTIQWNLSGIAGKRGYLEIVDGLEVPSYAWLAVGKITPRVVQVKEFDDGRLANQLLSAIRICRDQQRSEPMLSSGDLSRMKRIVVTIQLGGDVRSAAAAALILHHKKTSVLAVAELLKDASTPGTVDKAIVAFCVSPQPKVDEEGDADAEVLGGDVTQQLMKTVFSGIEQRLRVSLTRGLAASRSGAQLLISAMKNGTPSAVVLRDERIVQQLKAFGGDMVDDVDALLETLPPEETNDPELIGRILKRLRLNEGDSEAGKAVFLKNCAVCHLRNGEGGKVGPQLDGIITRGVPRLLEDILQPNQNVDVAFRSSTLVMDDGRVVSGIVRPGQNDTFVNVFGVDGKSTEVQLSHVEERVDGRLSLMPANVSRLLKEDDLLNLIQWLSK